MPFDTEYYMQIVFAYLKRSEPIGSTITISETCEIDQLGTYICALANLAAYKKIPYTYAIWGINQDTREISGTSFIPPSAEQLALNLPIKAVYSILQIAIDDTPIVMLEVQCPSSTTMQYKGTEYIFIKDELKELSSVPDVEKKIWANLEDHVPFESQIAKSNVSMHSRKARVSMGKVCTFFGHRDCPSSIKPTLRKALIDLIENHAVDAQVSCSILKY